MVQKWDKMALLLKTEGTYGTDAAPTGAVNSIMALNPAFDANPSTRLARDLVKPTPGTVAEPLAARHVGLNFDVELAGAGAVDSAPKYGPALRACALAETITPTTGPVTYDPVSTGEESCTIYFHADGTLHKMVGVRGSVSVVFEPDAVPLLRFAMLGLHVNPAAAALPTTDFTGYQPPLAASVVNTPTFTLHGVAAVLRSLTIDLANRVTYRDLVGAESVEITGRAPAGSLSIEAPALGTQDWFAVERALTLGALQLIHGTAVGNIAQLDCPKVQLINPQYEDVDGVRFLNMDLNVAENAGNDEFKLTTK